MGMSDWARLDQDWLVSNNMGIVYRASLFDFLSTDVAADPRSWYYAKRRSDHPKRLRLSLASSLYGTGSYGDFVQGTSDFGDTCTACGNA